MYEQMFNILEERITIDQSYIRLCHNKSTVTTVIVMVFVYMNIFSLYICTVWIKYSYIRRRSSTVFAVFYSFKIGHW